MSRASERTKRNLIDMAALLFAVAVLVVVYTMGRDFYEMSVNARIDHDRYDELKSSGAVGK